MFYCKSLITLHNYYYYLFVHSLSRSLSPSLSLCHTCFTNYFRFLLFHSIANEAALAATRPSSCAVRGWSWGRGRGLRSNRDVIGCEGTAARASVSHNAHGDGDGDGGLVGVLANSSWLPETLAVKHG